MTIAKVLISFTSRPFQVNPKGRRGKENTSPAKQQAGFETETFDLQSNALTNNLVTVLLISGT